MPIEMNIFRPSVLIVAALLLAPASAEDRKALEPVDGREGGWNHVWSQLQNTHLVPHGRHMAALLVEPSFEPAWFCTLGRLSDGKVMGYCSRFGISREQKQESDSPIESKSKSFNHEIAAKINRIWIVELLRTHYAESSDAITTDGVHCVAGGVDDEKPTRYLMGQFTQTDGSPLNWMNNIMQTIREYITTESAEREKTCVEKIKKLVTEQEDKQRKNEPRSQTHGIGRANRRQP